MKGRDLTVGTLLTAYARRISLTWLMILCETVLAALIPLFIGFAIDGLLAAEHDAFWKLAVLMGGLIAVAVSRRIYDTRVYGTIRVDLGKAQTERSTGLPVSTLNARIGMGRELVDFLEETLPLAVGSAVHLVIAVAILAAFSPVLALAAGAAAAGMVLVYTLFHRRFYRLNGELNQETERQVDILGEGRVRAAVAHFLRIRRLEVRLSDAEAVLYGAVFVVLLALILFNLWFATTALTVSTGTVFSIVSYSWEFVESALALPMTLQSWTRLSEIARRLNSRDALAAAES